MMNPMFPRHMRVPSMGFCIFLFLFGGRILYILYLLYTVRVVRGRTNAWRPDIWRFARLQCVTVHIFMSLSCYLIIVGFRLGCFDPPCMLASFGTAAVLPQLYRIPVVNLLVDRPLSFRSTDMPLSIHESFSCHFLCCTS